MINNNYKYIFNIFLFLLIFFIQIYFPIIDIGKIHIQADIILLYITVLAILYGRFIAIVIGFIAGLFQDFSTQNELLGIFSLSKPITAYCLGSIFNYKTIWSKKIQYFVIFISYVLHFFIYFYLFARSIFDFYYLSIFIFLHSAIVFILLLILNKLVYKNRLL